MKESARNKIKGFLKKYCKVIWRLREAGNEKKMLARYEAQKNMTESQRREKLEQLYKNYIGKDLHLDNPVTFTEKMQRRKLYEKDERMTRLSDKALVRDWVKEQIGEQYLIPAYGIYDSFDEIDFDALPDRFVLKANHASGWNIIVKDKSKLNLKEAKRKFDLWLSLDYSYISGFEMHYQEITPKIVCEQYIETDKGDLPDYKFLCFNGEVKYCWVDLDRHTNHTRNFYDLDWNLQPFKQCHENSSYEVKKPRNFEKMVELARVLCQDFSHVRVDFYNLDGVIYFGEMTFTSASGFERFLPDEKDIELGQMWAQA